MKIAKLFVLGALLLMGNSAMAEIVDGVRQQPKPKTVGFQAETEAYLYNVDAAQFFTQGNAWGTQASTSTASGLKVKFAKYTLEGAEWDGKTYLFNDYRNNAWFYVFFDSETQMYVDLGNQTDKNTGWEVEENGGGIFRLSASSVVPTTIPGKTQTFTGGLTKQEGKYVGLDLSENAGNTALTPFLAPGEGICLNWALVAVEEYEALVPQLELYAASIPLKELLDKAKEIGADVAEQEAIYLNEGSTVAELNAAAKAAAAAIEAKEKELAQGEMGKATADNPVDATLFIVNPDFAGNDGKTGWSGTEFGAVNAKDNAEHYEKTYDSYQKIEGLPNGVYALGVNAFYRAGSTTAALSNYLANNADSKNAKLYAYNGVDTLKTSIVSPFKGAPTESQCSGEASASSNGVTYYIPNNMEAAEYYMHTLGLYGNTVFATVEDGTLTIGVRKDVTIGSDWTIFDDFSLMYYGNGADAYQKWYDVTVDGMDVYAGQEITANHTKKYADEYAAAFAELRAVKVTDKAGVIAAIEAAEEKADEASAALALNIKLWAQFAALMDEAEAVAANQDLDPAYTELLYDWAHYDAPKDLKALTMTNEELQETVDAQRKAIDEAYRHVAAGGDASALLTNPGFEDGANGWTIYNPKNAVATTGGTNTNTCFEAFTNPEFDIYQIVKDAPKGIYAISVQGFYRYGRGTNAYNAYLAQEVDYVKKGKAPVYIYMNDNATSFTNVYGDPKQIDDETFYSANSSDYESETDDDGNVWYFPNGMASAAVAFSDGMYTQSAYGVVANDGDVMRIGVKGNSSQEGDSWAIWDNFKLTFMGFDNVEIVKPILEQTLPVSQELLNSTMGKSVKEDLTKTLGEAEAAVNGTDGTAMFNALSALLTANSNANKSVALFTTLITSLDELYAAVNGDFVCSIEVATEAQNMYFDINGQVEDGVLEDSDAEESIEKVAAMLKKMSIPAEMDDASDANEVPCTTMMVNPKYDNGTTGWTTKTGNAGVEHGVCEVYDSNFDHYQDIDGLPEGTYTATVQGFYRYGTAVEDYAAYTEDREANNNLLVYAISGEVDYEALMPRLASAAEQYTAAVDSAGAYSPGTDMVWAVADSVLVYSADSTTISGPRVPNMRSTASEFFASENGKKLTASVTFKVGEDGKARIGLKKTVQKEKNWCTMNEWTLTYYGKNSNKQLDTTGIKDTAAVDATVVKTELFTIGGTRINNAAKGIIIVKETLSNGAVKVKKVAVK